jgi:membrane protein implicated in regulation of membrane protease activity
MNVSLVSYAWLALAVAFGVIEAAAPMLVCVWFCAGAFVTFLVSLFVDDVVVQLVVFTASSVAMLCALRPFFRRRSGDPRGARTDVDALVGRPVTITQAVPAGGQGRALLGDTSWFALSDDGASLPTGCRARVVRVDGTRLVVRRDDGRTSPGGDGHASPGDPSGAAIAPSGDEPR